MKVFLDSSALVKRYIDEPGSDRLAQILLKAEEVAVCILCITEVLSACNRLVRENKLNTEQYLWIKNEFLLDIAELVIIDLTNNVVIRSIQCVENGVIRSLDALHIASAAEYKCTLFLTGDVRQQEIADAMGLKTELV